MLARQGVNPAWSNAAAGASLTGWRSAVAPGTDPRAGAGPVPGQEGDKNGPKTRQGGVLCVA